MNRQITRCLFRKSIAFGNVKTCVFASVRASKPCCPSVDIHTARSKTAILGRQQLYAVPAQSTAQVAILVLPCVNVRLLNSANSDCDPLLKLWCSISDYNRTPPFLIFFYNNNNNVFIYRGLHIKYMQILI